MLTVIRIIGAVLGAILLLPLYLFWLLFRAVQRSGVFQTFQCFNLHRGEPLKIRAFEPTLEFCQDQQRLVYRITMSAEVIAAKPVKTRGVALEWRLAGVHVAQLHRPRTSDRWAKEDEYFKRSEDDKPQSHALYLYEQSGDERGLYIFNGESRHNFVFESYFDGWRGLHETLARWHRARLVIGKSKSDWFKIEVERAKE